MTPRFWAWETRVEKKKEKIERERESVTRQDQQFNLAYVVFENFTRRSNEVEMQLYSLHWKSVKLALEIWYAPPTFPNKKLKTDSLKNILALYYFPLKTFDSYTLPITEIWCELCTLSLVPIILWNSPSPFSHLLPHTHSFPPSLHPVSWDITPFFNTILYVISNYSLKSFLIFLSKCYSIFLSVFIVGLFLSYGPCLTLSSY